MIRAAPSTPNLTSGAAMPPTVLTPPGTGARPGATGVQARPGGADTPGMHGHGDPDRDQDRDRDRGQDRVRVARGRGWFDRGATTGRAVTSARLGPAARPRSRLFPKTRSWFALDAPLELLSPLSVLRVLFLLAAVVWPLAGLTTGAPARDRVGMAVVDASVLAVWIVLLSVRRLGPRACAGLAAYGDACVFVLVWLAHGSAAVAVFVAFLVPLSVFVALFLGRRAQLVQQAALVAGVSAALAPTVGVGRAVMVSVAVAMTLGFAPAAVLVLARSARRHDLVDPDTGLPNGFGLARRLESDARTCFLVAVVVLDGIGNAREAMGYQVGTELLRRAVEDLGQVLPGEAVIGRVSGDELVVTLGLEDADAVTPVVVHPDQGRSDGAPDDGPSATGLPGTVAEAGRALAELLVRAVAAGQYRVDTVGVHVRANVGLSAAPWDGTAVSELVRRASISARRAADAGVPSMAWDGDRGALTAADLELVGDLAGAAGRGELSAGLPAPDGGDRPHHGGRRGAAAVGQPHPRPRPTGTVRHPGRAQRPDRRPHRVGGGRGPGRPVEVAPGRHRRVRLGQPVGQVPAHPRTGRLDPRGGRQAGSPDVLSDGGGDRDRGGRSRPGPGRTEPTPPNAGSASPSTTSEPGSPRWPSCPRYPWTSSRSISASYCGRPRRPPTRPSSTPSASWPTAWVCRSWPRGWRPKAWRSSSAPWGSTSSRDTTSPGPCPRRNCWRWCGAVATGTGGRR